MPAYDRPIQFNLPQRKPQGHDSVGAVIQFCTGASEEEVARVQAFLDRCAERGIIKPTSAQTYNSAYGGPVWYIP